MVIREMTFDDIAEVAELERLYSQTPWDATGIFSWWMRDDTLFLVAGEELDEADGEDAFAKEKERTSGAEDKSLTEEDEDYVPPVVYGYVGLVMV
ncbi:MAG: hypothetical protein ACSW8H_10850, partial [bacterium]